MNFFKVLVCVFLFGFPLSVWAESGVTADVGELNFGGQAVNSFSDPQTVTLTNTVPGDGVIWTATLAGENPQQFLILEDYCSATVLGAGESCELQIIYAPFFSLPGGVGTSSALLQVPFNDPPSLSIPLSGEGLLPGAAADPLSLTFPKTTAGEATDSSTVTVSNQGEAPLDLSLITIAGPDSISFNIEGDDCSFQTLDPGESCAIQVFFRPIQKGNMSASIVVESSDPVNPELEIQLSGEGRGSGGCQIGSGEEKPAIFFLAINLTILVLGKRLKKCQIRA